MRRWGVAHTFAQTFHPSWFVLGTWSRDGHVLIRRYSTERLVLISSFDLLPKTKSGEPLWITAFEKYLSLGLV